MKNPEILNQDQMNYLCVPGTSNLLAIPAIDCFRARSRGGSGFSVGPSSSQGSG